jgi:hypothetical protein
MFFSCELVVRKLFSIGGLSVAGLFFPFACQSA